MVGNQDRSIEKWMYTNNTYIYSHFEEIKNLQLKWEKPCDLSKAIRTSFHGLNVPTRITYIGCVKKKEDVRKNSKYCAEQKNTHIMNETLTFLRVLQVLILHLNANAWKAKFSGHSVYFSLNVQKKSAQ